MNAEQVYDILKDITDEYPENPVELVAELEGDYEADDIAAAMKELFGEKMATGFVMVGVILGLALEQRRFLADFEVPDSL